MAGPVDNRSGGLITVAGSDTRAIFWDDLHNDGLVSVSDGSAALFLGLVSIARALWLFQARKRVVRRAEVTVLTATQKIERNRV